MHEETHCKKSGEATKLLERIQSGDGGASDDLQALVYTELRTIAAHKMAVEGSGHTLQPTALVHEAWLRMVDSNGRLLFKNRAHFFGAAAEAMRRILIDSARRKQAKRHGGGWERVDLQNQELVVPSSDEELLNVADALGRFAKVEPQKAELVKLRYFVGMTIEEAAAVLSISEPTAKRWWAYAKAWLAVEIKKPTNGMKS